MSAQNWKGPAQRRQCSLHVTYEEQQARTLGQGPGQVSPGEGLGGLVEGLDCTPGVSGDVQRGRQRDPAQRGLYDDLFGIYIEATAANAGIGKKLALL